MKAITSLKLSIILLLLSVSNHNLIGSTPILSENLKNLNLSNILENAVKLGNKNPVKFHTIESSVVKRSEEFIAFPSKIRAGGGQNGLSLGAGAPHNDDKINRQTIGWGVGFKNYKDPLIVYLQKLIFVIKINLTNTC